LVFLKIYISISGMKIAGRIRRCAFSAHGHRWESKDGWWRGPGCGGSPGVE
jgi:hypothetical protein